MFPSATTEILWMTVVIRGPSSVATFRATIEQSTKAHTAFSRGLVGQILVRRPPDLPDLLLRPCILVQTAPHMDHSSLYCVHEYNYVVRLPIQPVKKFTA